jgi:prevent-host-death family protein
VEQGGEIVITRNGKPVARLSPVRQTSREEKLARNRKFIEFAREFRATLEPTTHEEIKEMIEHGRR